MPWCRDYVPGAGGALAVPDETAVHAGCPIIEGTKFIATRWGGLVRSRRL